MTDKMEIQQKNNDRVMFLDYLKAVGIILVVALHVVQFCFGFKHSDVVTFFGIFHMPLFFVISGYLAYSTKLSGYKVISKIGGKARALLIPLLFWSIVYCIAHSKSFVNLCLGDWGGYWFLYTLLLCFVILYIAKVLSYALFKDKPYGELIVFVAVYICILVADFLVHDLPLLPLHKLVTYLRYFFIGYFVNKHIIAKKFVTHNIFYVVGVACLFAQYYWNGMHNMLLIFLGALGGVFILWKFFSDNEEAIKHTVVGHWLASLGRCTLGVYCIHFFFLSDISAAVHPLLDVPGGFFVRFFASLVCALVIIAACMLIIALIRHNVYTRYIMLGEKNR